MTPAIASPNTLELPPFALPTQAGRELQVSETVRLAAVTDRRQDITLTTKEGDTVSLSLDQSTVAIYGRDGRLSQIRQYGGDAADPQTTRESLAVETREWFGIESSRAVTLSIDGDLSKAERRDIRKALRRIHRLMGQTFGADPAAVARASGLSGLNTLTAVEVEIQQSRTILAAQSSSASARAYGADGQEAPAADQSSTTERSIWQAATDDVVGIVAETETAPQHFAEPLRHLFHHWAGQMRRHHRRFEPLVRAMAHTVFERLRIMPQDAGPDRVNRPGNRSRSTDIPRWGAQSPED